MRSRAGVQDIVAADLQIVDRRIGASATVADLVMPVLVALRLAGTATAGSTARAPK